ncbi:MAG: hypothetical protein FWG50_13135 [Kiritimatiellaeota bacterium]|nr:hypothetical protein [Kiritimatiellota bacterium]
MKWLSARWRTITLGVLSPKQWLDMALSRNSLLLLLLTSFLIHSDCPAGNVAVKGHYRRTPSGGMTYVSPHYRNTPGSGSYSSYGGGGAQIHPNSFSATYRPLTSKGGYVGSHGGFWPAYPPLTTTSLDRQSDAIAAEELRRRVRVEDAALIAAGEEQWEKETLEYVKKRAQTAYDGCTEPHTNSLPLTCLLTLEGGYGGTNTNSVSSISAKELRKKRLAEATALTAALKADEERRKQEQAEAYALIVASRERWDKETVELLKKKNADTLKVAQKNVK